jgi:hypothetical protein
MEFRIAPMMLAFFNLLLITLVNPNVNQMVSLQQVTPIWKFILPFVVIHSMAWGSFSRHSYYSNTFKLIFYSVQVIGLLMAAYYAYAIQQQHLL